MCTSRIVTISDMARVMAMMDAGPAPIHTINTGPRAVLGRELSTTRYGSRMRESMGLHHSRIAITVPASVPRVKPITVSRHDAPRCRNSSPEAYRFFSVFQMRDGLLMIKSSIQPCCAAISHSAKKPISNPSWASSTQRFCRLRRRR